MANLTTESLKKILDSSLSDQDKRFDKKLAVLKEELEAFVEKKNDELGRMTSKGFEDVLRRLDFKERVERLEKFMYTVADSFNIKV